ncbi:hypothetical protein CAL26_23745 [Bordetella genomosp. 9]|uniref:Uncharacterized protein n=1 Tax=Bordetella genomosp. 9 TaxID=1416803 RepID=A0A261R6D1_9BORD|nr:hypothetical protein [Bordetella genomosp. 9]OZI20511.1 hypothetical protein CAL26_23745 [Bordetella genomosp. 9]
MQLNDKDQKDLDRSIQAERIMQDPLVLEALSLMDQHIHDLWAGEGQTPLGPAEREELYRMLQAKNRFIAAFEAYLQNGAAARHMLEMEPPSKTFLQRIKEYFHG